MKCKCTSFIDIYDVLKVLQILFSDFFDISDFFVGS